MLTCFKQLIRYHHIKKFLETYERFLMPATLLVGVCIDFVTFRSISIESTFFLLGIYLIVAALTLVFMNAHKVEQIPTHGKLFTYLRLASPFILQFTFGALLSASLIFYWFSGALSVSWPLIVLLALLMVSNEVFRHYYTKPMVQLSVYFFALFSFSTLLVPYLTNSIEPFWFVVAGAVSLTLMFSFITLLAHVSVSIREGRRRMITTAILITACMNAFYFLNIIPPIPLSIREAGVYHRIARISSGYRLVDEDRSWFSRLSPVPTIHLQPSDPVFIFSSIFAPTELNTTIIHEWQRYDETKKAWVNLDRLSFSIRGGRDEGYRGYSMKSRVEAGKWRVRVETPHGQTLGYVRFRVEKVDVKPELVEVVK